MKMQSKVDTVPGYNVEIPETTPMVIAVGDLYPTGGKVKITFDRDMVYEFQGLQMNYKSVDLQFTGKQGELYGAIATIHFMAGPVEQQMSASFLLDKNGIVDGSLKFITE